MGIFDLLAEVEAQALQRSSNEAVDPTRRFDDHLAPLSFADIACYDKGIEPLVGGVDSKLLRGMHTEHCMPPGAEDWFDVLLKCGTMYRTNPKLEWAYVAGEDSIDVEKWDLKAASKPKCEVEGMRGKGEYRNLKSVDELQSSGHAQGLSRAEIVAVRLFTGPMYSRYNRALREERREYATTVHLIASGIVKLCQRAPLGHTERCVRLCLLDASNRAEGECAADCADCPGGTRVAFRGVRDRKLPRSFLEADDQGFKGGVELGFLSMSTSRGVAEEYAARGAAVAQDPGGTAPAQDAGREGLDGGRMVLELELGPTCAGADVSGLSQFEGEGELLLPPLTHLEVVRIEGEGGCEVVSLRPTLCQAVRTKEQIEAGRRSMLRSIASSLTMDLGLRELAKGGKWPEWVKHLESRQAHVIESQEPEWYADNGKFSD